MNRAGNRVWVSARQNTEIAFNRMEWKHMYPTQHMNLRYITDTKEMHCKECG